MLFLLLEQVDLSFLGSIKNNSFVHVVMHGWTCSFLQTFIVHMPKVTTCLHLAGLPMSSLRLSLVRNEGLEVKFGGDLNPKSHEPQVTVHIKSNIIDSEPVCVFHFFFLYGQAKAAGSHEEARTSGKG